MARNPGLSFKVIDGEEIIGTGIFGRDGRRGYIHHLAVKEGYSRKRIGKVLVDRSLKELQALGVRKCRLFIATEDADSVELRRSIEWTEGTDFMLFSHDIEYPSPS